MKLNTMSGSVTALGAERGFTWSGEILTLEVRTMGEVEAILKLLEGASPVQTTNGAGKPAKAVSAAEVEKAESKVAESKPAPEKKAANKPAPEKEPEAPKASKGKPTPAPEEEQPYEDTQAESTSDLAGKLKDAKRLVDVIALLRQHGHSTKEQIIKACIDNQESVPALSRVVGDMRERVERALESSPQ